MVYLSDTGKLEFGNQAGSTKVVIKGAKSYNDGAWHYLVATSGAQGMNLFVDGVPVAINPNTQNASYAGYWKVGYDSLTGWPDKPANTALKGGVDEVAVYPTQLTRAQVVAHYLAGRPSAVIDLTPPPTPADVTATQSGQNATVTWDASTDNIGVAGYQVYRTAGPTDDLSAASLVGSTTSALSFTETNVPQGLWYYRVVAVDGAGNPSDPSDPSAVTIPPPPVSLSVVDTADTYVHSSLKTSNFGTSTLFSVDARRSRSACSASSCPTLRPGPTWSAPPSGYGPRPTASPARPTPSPCSSRPTPGPRRRSPGTPARRFFAGTPRLPGRGDGAEHDLRHHAGPRALAASVGASTTLALPGGGAGDGSEFQSREATNNRPTLILGFAP